MINLDKIQPEIDEALLSLRGVNDKAIFLIKRLANSLDREIQRRIELEGDVVEQREYIETLYEKISSLEHKVELLKKELKMPTRKKDG